MGPMPMFLFLISCFHEKNFQLCKEWPIDCLLFENVIVDRMMPRLGLVGHAWSAAALLIGWRALSGVCLL